ncbi:glycerophosphoryl diester phosphodiesterase [Paraburkholderia eburnea]|uniref:Glycerophosphoryl diester phosphodiesterase n=2 Tax=Paraburkholderia eburnea TaxID=1189126 RepID=A0A2S4LTC6_9BURK|nr:glycerophosphoryl diester phosphodiesterase [Paraburkholderia eburnea]PRZ14492.1 glycerophosphoryl diester phosphodiesterase [Paraburkholderia eburnea]
MRNDFARVVEAPTFMSHYMMRTMPWRAVAVVSTALLLAACAGGPASPGASQPQALRTMQAVPLVIAHRGGTGDAPENTLVAIRSALASHADAIWLTVQLSRDGVPVLYRPGDLAALTDAHGPVAAKSAAELARVNAGWQFKSQDAWPYRQRAVGIPTLAEALAAIPADTPVILDMKALPAAPQAAAVAHVLDEAGAWDRVLLYSTEADYQQAFTAWPRARVFESRDATRARLANVALAHTCEAPPLTGAWTAFEWRRSLDLTERFTLGEAHSSVADAQLWSPQAVQCFRTNPGVHIVAIAVNSAADYKAAACAGLDAVLADSPRRMTPVRDALRQGYRCP